MHRGAWMFANPAVSCCLWFFVVIVAVDVVVTVDFVRFVCICAWRRWNIDIGWLCEIEFVKQGYPLAYVIISSSDAIFGAWRRISVCWCLCMFVCAHVNTQKLCLRKCCFISKLIWYVCFGIHKHFCSIRYLALYFFCTWCVCFVFQNIGAHNGTWIVPLHNSHMPNVVHW